MTRAWVKTAFIDNVRVEVDNHYTIDGPDIFLDDANIAIPQGRYRILSFSADSESNINLSKISKAESTVCKIYCDFRATFLDVFEGSTDISCSLTFYGSVSGPDRKSVQFQMGIVDRIRINHQRLNQQQD
ncbi:MAG: hypothetical protein WA790_07115 [Sulfitobacter sp.]